MDTVERFWTKVDKSRGLDACWLWTGQKDKDGYGKFAYREAGSRSYLRAHRFAFEMTGRRLGSLMALHNCDTPACVNPEHLRAGTVQENAQDAVDRGRFARGEACAMSRGRSLSQDDVRSIRAAALAGESHESIATRYPVQRRQVSRVAQGTRYAWVTASADR